MGDNGGRLSLNQIASIDEDKNLIEAHFTNEKNRNSPLKDGKHSMYEGGLRVPFMVTGPRIKSNRVSNVPVTGLDLLPTFAEIAGYEEKYPPAIDGGSLSPLLENENIQTIKRSRDALFFHQSSHRQPRSAVILDDFKIVKYWKKENKYADSPKVELFNIKKDLQESKDISKAYPTKTKELETLLDSFVIETNTCTSRRPEVESAVYRVLRELEKEKVDSLPGKKLSDLDIYLVIGQSNMAGRASIPENLKDPIPGAYVFANNDELPWVKATNPLNRYSTVRKKMSMQRLSPAYSFTKKMIESDPSREIGLVVNAKGGTSIVQWLPGANLYEEAISQTKEALNYGKLKGIIWHQGESDSDSLRTSMYLARIEVVINSLREEFDDPNLPFIAGQVYPSQSKMAFNKVLEQLPNFIKNTALVSSEGTSVIDNVHFDAESILILGERYAQAMLDLHKKNK